MTFLEAHQKFREIEDAHDLFNLRINNFPVWDYLRFPIWRQFLEATQTSAKAHHNAPPGGILAHAKRWLNVLRQTAFNNPFLAGKCDYLFLGHPRRKLMRDGKYWDIYSDPIINHLGSQKCLLLEDPTKMGMHPHMKPACTKRLAYSDALRLYQRLHRIKPGSSPLDQGEINFLNKIAQAFEQYSTKNEDFGLAQMVQQRFKNDQLASTFFDSLLKKINPKAVFLVCSYNHESKIKVCRANNIPTIELQHGVMTPYHPGYAYPAGTNKELFPDYFFSFGKYWEETVELPLHKKRIYTIGYPYFDQQRSFYSSTSKKNTVLIISQGTIGDRLSGFALKLNKRLPADWNLIFKLHPGEALGWRERYTELAASEIPVVEKDTPPLYQLMAEAKIQIGISSTALFEGLRFNCRTYIVKIPGYEYMQPLIDQNICTLISSPAEVNFSNVKPGCKFNENYFFADNWVENLEQAMDNIGIR